MKSLDQKTAAPQHQQDVQAEAKSSLFVFVVFLFQKQVKEYFYTDNTQQENLKHLQCLFIFQQVFIFFLSGKFATVFPVTRITRTFESLHKICLFSGQTQICLTGGGGESLCYVLTLAYFTALAFHMHWESIRRTIERGTGHPSAFYNSTLNKCFKTRFSYDRCNW